MSMEGHINLDIIVHFEVKCSLRHDQIYFINLNFYYGLNIQTQFSYSLIKFPRFFAGTEVH